MVGGTRGMVLTAAAALALPMVLGLAGLGCAEQEDNPFLSGCPTARPRCGDGCVDLTNGETCDDGNRLPGDGCSSACLRESGGDAGDVPADDAVTPDDGRDTTPPTDDGGGTDTGTCPESPCRLKPSCGCPAGQKCTLDFVALSEGTLVKQCGDAGPGTSSSMCEADTDCAAATICSALYTEASVSAAMCADVCNSAADCSGAGSICLPLLETTSSPGTCTHACDPTTNSGCPSGTACQILTLSSTMEDLTDCTADVGYGAPLDSCTDGTGCAAGSFCADGDGDTVGDTCIQWCRYPSGSCSGGNVCYEFTDSAGIPMPLEIGGTEYGYCYLPA